MDKAFSYFLIDNGFGPAEQTQTVPPDAFERYSGKLPDRLLQYWREHGWSSYGKGLFWLVDPGIYEPVVEEWLQGTSFVDRDSYYVIARTAFGELYLWGTKSGQCLTINPPWGQIFPHGDDSAMISEGKSDCLVESFFVAKYKKYMDMEDIKHQLLFDRALAALGPLSASEMYGFEPALALGGIADLKFLRRVDAVVHLIILAQLDERKIMRDIVKDAQALGLIKK